MVVKSYTLDILDVLSAWLREKGWDVETVTVGEFQRDSSFYASFALICDDGSLVEFETILTRSYLDANNYMLINGKRPKGHVEKYIRAELERQVRQK